MRSLRSGVAVGAALAVTAGLGVLATTTPADAAGKVVITEVHVTPGSSFHLTGTHTAVATVAFRLQVPAGQQTSVGSATLPAVVMAGSSGAPVAVVPATRTSGSLRNGLWRASFPLGAADVGTFQLRVRSCPIGSGCSAHGVTSSDLGAALTVTGGQPPRIVNIVQTPARLPAGVTSGSAVGQVVVGSGNTAVAGAQIAVLPPGGQPSRVATTDGTGAFIAPWRWPVHPNGIAETLQVRLSTSAGPVVVATKQLGMPRGRFAIRMHHPAYAAAGGRYVVTGVVRPGSPATRMGHVALQLWRGGAWRTVDTAPVRPRWRHKHLLNSGGFRLATQFRSLTTVRMRVIKSDAGCDASGCAVLGRTGHGFSVATGSRNELVEHQLAHFGFPVGTVDGVIDARAEQALCAWRDATGQPINRGGVTDRIANSVLNATSKPKPDRPDGLYVDKTCQILFQVVNGHFRRILWASTGMPGLDTPNVTGAIFRKVDGIVESTLYPGAFMWWPMFFNPARPAIALHGSATNDLVLPYPASHGCIRVWRPQIIDIFNESPLGTRVVVYGEY
jgi:hypothetical protein